MGIGLTRIDDLILRSTAGDATAIESVLLHFHDPLLQFIRSTLAAPDSADFSAEDLFQETLVEAFRRVKGLEAQGSIAFFAWLKTIAHHRHLNRLKAAKALKRGGARKRIVNGIATESTATSILHLIAGTEARPSVIVRRKEAVGVVAVALSKLDAERRQVIELRYGQRMSNAQVAEKMGKSEGAIKMLISRTLQELRKSIQTDFKDFTAGP